jgi:hypothetical protein
MTQNVWPAPQRSDAIEPFPTTRNIPLSGALLGWLASYAVAVILGASIANATGQIGVDNPPTWFVALSALSLWLPFIGALLYLSRTRGTANFKNDYSLRFAWVDLAGIPLGIFSQLVVVNVVTLPFRRYFPGTFDPEQVSRRAKDLVDSANGVWLLVLATVVVVGAPVIEELVYRGMLQKSMATSFGPVVAAVVSAAFFTVVHLVPVEFPGLFAFALILGFAFRRTNRIGFCIVTHMSFNAAGLLLVLLT